MFALRQAPWRLALTFGGAAAALAWLTFFATGGVAGARGELPAAVAFAIGAIGSGLAGFVERRVSTDLPRAVLAGLLTGCLAGIFYDFPHTAVLLLSHSYMTWIQTLPHANLGKFGINLGYLHRLAQLGAGLIPPLPKWGMRLAAALVGALLSGGLVVAATGSIGGALGAGRTETMP